MPTCQNLGTIFGAQILTSRLRKGVKVREELPPLLASPERTCNHEATRGANDASSPLALIRFWHRRSRTGATGVELMLVALQLSSGEVLVATILIIALLIWAFSQSRCSASLLNTDLSESGHHIRCSDSDKSVAGTRTPDQLPPVSF